MTGARLSNLTYLGAALVFPTSDLWVWDAPRADLQSPIGPTKPANAPTNGPQLDKLRVGPAAIRFRMWIATLVPRPSSRSMTYPSRR